MHQYRINLQNRNFANVSAHRFEFIEEAPIQLDRGNEDELKDWDADA